MGTTKMVNYLFLLLVTNACLVEGYTVEKNRFGDDDACSTTNPCGTEEGDCDSNSECMWGLKCGTNNCNKTVYTFDNTDDCCYFPYRFGDDSACSTSDPCGPGEGDCNSNFECMSGLNCGTNNCNRSLSTFDSTDDCCYKTYRFGGDSACSTSNPCGPEEGDCDSDSECMSGLKCGINNCDIINKSTFDSTDDCCYKPYRFGNDRACSISNRCGSGEGDCDSDSECMSGLKCGTNNCNRTISTFDNTDDCCYKPHRFGGDSACSTSNPCGPMEGDCDSDFECMSGLKCGTNNCDRSISTFDSTDDCCCKSGTNCW